MLIIGVEFWERFSFYGMLSILVLFLTGSPAHGGFGWPAAEALVLLGAYSGAMYAFPAFGGYFADRVLGRRRAVTLGATCMLIGQIMLASPVFLPAILGWWHAAPLLQTLHELGVPLGRVLPSDAVNAAIVRHGAALEPRAGAAWLKQAYTAATLGFFFAIFCLVLGNALMKSTLVVLCGETMSTDDPRREGAYAYYYLGISVGAMLSGVAVGTAAQAFGWHFGFAVTAAGMSVALGSYLLLAPRWLGAIGLRPDGPAPMGEPVGDHVAAAAEEYRRRGAPAHRAAIRVGDTVVRVQRRMVPTLWQLAAVHRERRQSRDRLIRHSGALVHLDQCGGRDRLGAVRRSVLGAPRHPQSTRRYRAEIYFCAGHGNDRSFAHVSGRAKRGAERAGLSVDPAGLIVIVGNRGNRRVDRDLWDGVKSGTGGIRVRGDGRLVPA